MLAAPCVVGADGNRDGLPTVILESLALGTPVVATPVTGIPEPILRRSDRPARARARPGGAGRRARPLLDDPDLRCSLADAGGDTCRTHFDSRTNGGLLYDGIDRLARQPEAVGA